MVKKELFHMDGLILSANPFQDDSAIVLLASETGLKSFLCRSVYKMKSPLKAMLLAFNEVEVDYVEMSDDFYLARQASTRVDVSASYLDFGKNVFLTFLQECSVLFYQCGDSYPLKQVRSILKGMEDGKDLLTLLLLFLGALYSSLGIKMETRECILCHKKENLVSYSLKEGGFYCKNCTKEEIKNSMNLYVMKFAFMEPTEENKSRIVPKETGKKVLVELVQNLLDYFDIKRITSLSMVLQELS